MEQQQQQQQQQQQASVLIEGQLRELYQSVHEREAELKSCVEMEKKLEEENAALATEVSRLQAAVSKWGGSVSYLSKAVAEQKASTDDFRVRRNRLQGALAALNCRKEQLRSARRAKEEIVALVQKGLQVCAARSVKVASDLSKHRQRLRIAKEVWERERARTQEAKA